MKSSRPVLVLLLCMLCCSAWADTVLVIKPRETELTRAFVVALQEQSATPLLVQQLEEEPDTRSATYIVTMGREALQWRLQQDSSTHTVATYITLDQLGPAPQHPAFVQVLLVSSKPERQLQLAQLLIPRLKTAGILYSNQQQWQVSLWQRAAQRSGLKMQFQVVVLEQELLRSLSSVLNSSDVLIGIDDPQIYNANTLKPLLLSSYNRNRVLIGPSAPFVAAGSIGTTYSSPQDTAASVQLLMQEDWQPGAIRYPQFFRVLSNAQVARSLGLPPPDDILLQQQIQIMEQTSP